MSTQHEQGETTRNGGLWQRLNTWWDGDEDERPPAAAQHTLQPGACGAESEPEGGAWPQERIVLLDGLFGPGMVSPAADAVYKRLAGPLHLTGESRVVELGAGMGGLGHRLTGDCDAAVFAYNDEVEHADLAQGWLGSRDSRVKADRRDYHDTGLKRGFADAIIGKEPFTHVRRKHRVFQHLFHVLKPDGKIYFSDLFLTGDDPECPEVAVWSALERQPMHLVSPQRFRDMADDIGFDAPVFEDITPLYTEAIRKAFARTREILTAAGPLAPRLQPWLVSEAEYWNRRVTLLESGEAKVQCVGLQPYTGADLV